MGCELTPLLPASDGLLSICHLQILSSSSMHQSSKTLRGGLPNMTDFCRLTNGGTVQSLSKQRTMDCAWTGRGCHGVHPLNAHQTLPGYSTRCRSEDFSGTAIDNPDYKVLGQMRECGSSLGLAKAHGPCYIMVVPARSALRPGRLTTCACRA